MYLHFCMKVNFPIFKKVKIIFLNSFFHTHLCSSMIRPYLCLCIVTQMTSYMRIIFLSSGSVCFGESVQECRKGIISEIGILLSWLMQNIFFDQKWGGGGIHPLEFRTGIELQCILFYGFTDCWRQNSDL